jgi:hypothetical protein
MQAFSIDSTTRDISPLVFDDNGEFQILPASFWHETTLPERALLAVKHGMYLLPTLELIDHLKSVIAGRRAIEIGAGNGILAKALGIHATDNHMQSRPKYKAHYEALGQAPVRYGRDVEELEAHEAIQRYKPEVVVAAWVTHRYDLARHEAGGNEIGVDEDQVVDRASYLFVGNKTVHANKRIWARPHTIEQHDWLYSRAMNGSPNFIAYWQGGTK